MTKESFGNPESTHSKKTENGSREELADYLEEAIARKLSCARCFMMSRCKSPSVCSLVTDSHLAIDLPNSIRGETMNDLLSLAERQNVTITVNSTVPNTARNPFITSYHRLKSVLITIHSRIFYPG